MDDSGYVAFAHHGLVDLLPVTVTQRGGSASVAPLYKFLAYSCVVHAYR
jgi:hypothetical protein